ncbi:hypothetical protein BHM03_00028277 [Ensete ventricosum]|nr:hypothetical protein BHM03_00028277 [Ensete ventricosum]
MPTNNSSFAGGQRALFRFWGCKECCRHCGHHHHHLLRPHAAPTSSPLPPCALRHVFPPLCPCRLLAPFLAADVSLATAHRPRSPYSHALCYISTPTPLDRYRSTRATVSRKARNGAKQPLTPTWTCHDGYCYKRRVLSNKRFDSAPTKRARGRRWWSRSRFGFKPSRQRCAVRVPFLPVFGDRFFDTFFSAMPTSLDHKTLRPVARMNRRRHRRLPLLKRSRICYDIHGGRKQSPAAVGAVKERLHALRKLIPRKTDSVKKKETATDRIFEETAEYILLLRAQVEVLKLLVDFHSPSCMEKNGGMQ